MPNIIRSETHSATLRAGSQTRNSKDPLMSKTSDRYVKLLPGVKKIDAILVAAQVSCSAAFTVATSGQSMPSYAKRSTSGSDCPKPKDARFPGPPLFAKSKRLSDIIGAGERRYRLHIAIGRSYHACIYTLHPGSDYELRGPGSLNRCDRAVRPL